jgi:hypothetical protein
MEKIDPDQRSTFYKFVEGNRTEVLDIRTFPEIRKLSP